MDTPHEFFQAFDAAPIAIRNFLYKLFLDNLVVIDNRDWISLPYMGDIQLRALISWIQNEISRENQAHQYRELEYEMPLFLKPKPKDAITVYYEWLKIAYSKPRIWIIPPLREIVYQEYKAMAKIDLLATKQVNQWC